MCGYRIWGLVAAFIGYWLTGFFITFFGINITAEEAKNWGLGVGIAIYLIPLLAPWALSKIGIYISPQTNQPTTVTLSKERWETMMKIIESDCDTKGQKWTQWGYQIIGYIKANTARASSPDEEVTIPFSEENIKILNNIIDRKA